MLFIGLNQDWSQKNVTSDDQWCHSNNEPNMIFKRLLACNDFPIKVLQSFSIALTLTPRIPSYLQPPLGGHAELSTYIFHEVELCMENQVNWKGIFAAPQLGSKDGTSEIHPSISVTTLLHFDVLSHWKTTGYRLRGFIISSLALTRQHWHSSEFSLKPESLGLLLFVLQKPLIQGNGWISNGTQWEAWSCGLRTASKLMELEMWLKTGGLLHWKLINKAGGICRNGPH